MTRRPSRRRRRRPDAGGVVEDGQQTATGHDHVPGRRPDRHPPDQPGADRRLGLDGRCRASIRRPSQLGTLVLTLNESNSDTDNIGTVGWTFTLDNALAQQLAAGQVITQTYTVTIDDQHGGTITQDVTVTITGTNDGRPSRRRRRRPDVGRRGRRTASRPRPARSRSRTST